MTVVSHGHAHGCHGHHMVITWASHGHHMGIMESSYTIMSSYFTLRLGSPAAPRVSTSGLQSKAECNPCFHLRLHLSQNSWDCWVSPCGVCMYIPVSYTQQLYSCVYAIYYHWISNHGDAMFENWVLSMWYSEFMQSCNSFPNHQQSLPRIRTACVHNYSKTCDGILDNGYPALGSCCKIA